MPYQHPKGSYFLATTPLATHQIAICLGSRAPPVGAEHALAAIKDDRDRYLAGGRAPNALPRRFGNEEAPEGGEKLPSPILARG